MSELYRTRLKSDIVNAGLFCFLDRTVDFTVHIVGFEKSGKKTLGNALDRYFALIGLQGVLICLRSLDSLRTEELSGNEESSIVIFMYDICSEESFARLSEFLINYQANAGTKFCSSILVGNKLDLEYWRRVKSDSPLSSAQLMGTSAIEISAKVGLHVDFLCDILLRRMFPELREVENSSAISNLLREHMLKMSFEYTSSAEVDVVIDIHADSEEERFETTTSMVHVLPGEITSLSWQQEDVRPTLLRAESMFMRGPEKFGEVSRDIEMPLASLSKLGFDDTVNLASQERPLQRRQKAKIQLKAPTNYDGMQSIPSQLVDLSGHLGVDMPEKLVLKSKEMPRAPMESKRALQMSVPTIFDDQHLVDEDIFEDTDEREKDQALEQMKSVSARAESKVIKKRKVKESYVFQLSLYCGICMMCRFLPLDSCISILRGFFCDKALFDNVLADTENAFQAAAIALDYVIGIGVSFSWHTYIGVPLLWIISFCSLAFFTVVLILPSFFTLLIVRTSTTEKESTNFGVRQEVIRMEKPNESLVRWLRIIARSVPMAFYLLITPYLLVYHYFPWAPAQSIAGCLVGFTTSVIVLQALGTIRAYYSWKSRDIEVPACPDLYPKNIEPLNDDGRSRQYCLNSFYNCIFSNEKPLAIPKPPLKNNFKAISFSGVMLIGSLALEFFQMATFALQNNPYSTSDNSDPTSNPSIPTPTAAPTQSNYWGSKIFQILYVTVLDDIQYITMWFAVALVLLFILMFTAQFFSELRRYGFLLRDIKSKDEAKDSFFFSFTGSIVYGHGKPRNIHPIFRILVAVISDAFFLVISLRLLDSLACDYSSSVPVLLADKRITCWEGRHASLATCALTCYAFYVPLSIMIAPMLLEKDSSSKAEENSVSYSQLYLMVINVVKSVMLLVASLGPRTTVSLVLSTSISSLVMGALTISWFHYSEVKQYVDIQPASIAFINVWKTSSYFASVLTALLVVIAHSVGSSLFPEAALTAVLPVSWVFVIVVSFIYFRHWNIKDILLKSDIQDVVLAQYSLRHLNQDTISFSSSIDHFRDQPPLSFLLAEIWCQEQERNK